MDRLLHIGRTLLSLKHWQAFLFIAALCLLSILATPDFEDRSYGWLAYLAYIVFGFVLNAINFTLAISVGLYLITRANQRLGYEFIPRRRYVLTFVVPAAVILLLGLPTLIGLSPSHAEDNDVEGASFVAILFLYFFLLPVVLLTLIYSFSRLPKAYRVFQTGRPVGVREYAGAFLDFVFYFPFTMWHLQPSFNRIVEGEAETQNPQAF